MMSRIRWQCLAATGLGLAASVATTGCQTHVAGMTLPSPHYMEHRPQYFAPDPDYPLQRELSTMQAQAAAANAANGPRVTVPLPPPVAAPVAPVVPVAPAPVPPPPPAPVPGK